MGTGIRFSLKNDYRPMTIAPLNSRKCWEPEFQYALRRIAGDTYPQADYMLDGADPYVLFSKVRLGMDVLKNSKSYDQRKPSSSEVARVQAQIEQIHELANNPSIPTDRREFFRNFQLPNPRYMPECWRTAGFFRKRLYVLWGLSKGYKHSTFLPVSVNARDWHDQSDRVSLGDALGVPTAVNTGREKAKAGAGKSGSETAEPSVGSNETTSRQRDRIIFRWIIRVLLMMLIASLFRGCIRGCVPRFGIGSGGGSKSGLSDGTTNFTKEKGGLSDAMVTPDDADQKPKEGNAPDIPPELKGGEAQNGTEKAEDGAQTDVESDPTIDEDDNQNNEMSSKRVPPLSESQEKEGNLGATRALSYRFKVNSPRDLPSFDENVAKVEFSVSPMDDMGGKKYEVLDWRINGDVKKSGISTSFIPEDGLRYDKAYTISATVVMDGNPQYVEPFQWNTVDAPTWQIIECGRNEKTGMRQYKLICCNSSSVKPKVKDWKVEFRTNGENGEKALDFKLISNRIGEDVLEMRKSIGFFEGSYFMEMTADIDYELHGKVKSVTHVETFPFTHDSSADGLTKAKYEVVIPHVYFCLAKLEDGSLINGTAFAISEKLLLSNYHVAVGGIPECYANSGNYKVVGPVTLSNIRGRVFYAKVERFDRGRDLVILRLCDKKGNDTDDCLPGYLHLAEDALVAGISETSARHVFAIGYPKGTVCMGPPAFTDGKAEKVIKRDYDWRGRHQAFDTIVNYTSTQCGYSGGPLIDYQTESVLGVNFGGFIEKMEGHKAASLATSAAEVRLSFPNLKKK